MENHSVQWEDLQPLYNLLHTLHNDDGRTCNLSPTCSTPCTTTMGGPATSLQPAPHPAQRRWEDLQPLYNLLHTLHNDESFAQYCCPPNIDIHSDPAIDRRSVIQGFEPTTATSADRAGKTSLDDEGCCRAFKRPLRLNRYRVTSPCPERWEGR